MSSSIASQYNIDWQALLDKAIHAREYSYSPYSNYKVGASLLTVNKNIYTGCNIECVTYSPTICAERNAIFKAVSEGEREFLAIAVVTANGATPCGVCRQIMREFSPNLPVLIGDTASNYRIVTLAELLPQSFGPHSLIV